jgi:hypothetical protein
MWRRILVLDLALAGLLVFGVVQVRKSWQEFEASHRIESVRPEKEAARSLANTTAAARTPEDWTDISVKNPFSFDRNDVAIVAAKQALPVMPKPVLFGTMSIGKEWIAMMGPAQSGGRASRPIKIGESLDNWQVVEIRDKSAVVAGANGARETIIMNDPTAQAPRSAERTPTGGQAQVTVVNPTPTAPPPTTTSSAPAAPAAQPSPANQPADDILLTPFGPVKRTR